MSREVEYASDVDEWVDVTRGLARSYRERSEHLKLLLKGIYLGRCVRLTLPGGRNGRFAIIEDVALDSGEFIFLCMVTRSGTNPHDHDFLNSTADTRTYHHYSDFEFVDDKELVKTFEDAGVHDTVSESTSGDGPHERVKSIG